MRNIFLIIIFSFFNVIIVFSQTSDYNEFTWFNEYTIAYSYNGLNNIYVGYETVFYPGFSGALYPFSMVGVGANINFQYQFETQHFFIRNQSFIMFPYPLFLGADYLYNINTGEHDFSPVLGLFLFYPGLKIMFRKNIFKKNQNLEFIFAVSPPFFVKEKEWGRGE